MKTDNSPSNRLFAGIHASTQQLNYNQPYTSCKDSCSLFRDNIYLIENKSSNENTNANNVKLINSVRSKCGTGNFASLFETKLESSNNHTLLTNNSYKVSNTTTANNFSNDTYSDISLISTIITNGDLTDDHLNSSKTTTPSFSANELVDLIEDIPPQNSLMNMPVESFDDTIAQLDKCVYVDLTDTDDHSIESNINSDHESDYSTKNNADYEKLLNNSDNTETFDYSSTSQFDQLLKDFTLPKNKKNPSVMALLRVITERNEELVQLRQEYAELNNYIKSIPTRESLMEHLRSELSSSIALRNAEINKLKAENKSLNIRLLEMESCQYEKDNKIKQLLHELTRNEQEICRLNRNVKEMELNLEGERAEKLELSLESLKIQKAERLRGRLELSKNLELEKFDKMQIEKTSTDRLHMICGLKKSMNELENALKNKNENEKRLQTIIKHQDEKLENYKNEIVELKSLLLVSKTQKSLIDTYQSKLDELTCELNNEKLINQKGSVVKTLEDENIRNRKKLDESFLRKINAIVDKIRSKGKSIQVEWISDDMFKVQGKIVQVKLIGGKVCALKNGTPFPLELLLLN